MKNMTLEFKKEAIILFFCDLTKEQAEGQKERLQQELKVGFPDVQIDWGFSGVAAYYVAMDNPSLSKLDKVLRKCRDLGVEGLWRQAEVSEWCAYLGLDRAREVSALLESACDNIRECVEPKNNWSLYCHATLSLKLGLRLASVVEDKEDRAVILSIQERLKHQRE